MRIIIIIIIIGMRIEYHRPRFFMIIQCKIIVPRCAFHDVGVVNDFLEPLMHRAG